MQYLNYRINAEMAFSSLNFSIALFLIGIHEIFWREDDILLEF